MINRFRSMSNFSAIFLVVIFFLISIFSFTNGKPIINGISLPIDKIETNISIKGYVSEIEISDEENQNIMYGDDFFYDESVDLSNGDVNIVIPIIINLNDEENTRAFKFDIINKDFYNIKVDLLDITTSQNAKKSVSKITIYNADNLVIKTKTLTENNFVLTPNTKAELESIIVIEQPETIETTDSQIVFNFGLKYSVLSAAEEVDESENLAPVFSGSYVWFGEWPQTIKSDNVTITTTRDINGYYKGSDAKWYAKVVANPYHWIAVTGVPGSYYYADYSFSNNAKMIKGNEYYFQVEPIKWRILSNTSGTAILFAESMLETMAFQSVLHSDNTTPVPSYGFNKFPFVAPYPNNYEESQIRQWLIGEFYNKAFYNYNKALIQTTTVDNSATSTSSTTNPYICSNTSDKVFLLSYKDITTSSYGFSTNAETIDLAKQKKGTDYTLATGLYKNDSGYSYWWTRSPYHNDAFTSVNFVAFGYTNVAALSSIDFYGVIPAITITT